MKPETAMFVRKAKEFLVKARDQLNVLHYSDEAARAAYLAGLHAAQALIFERTGRVIKRHRGLQAEFRRLTADEPRVDPDLRSFLGRTYQFKAIADYDADPGSQVTIEQAEHAIDSAQRFVAYIQELLA